MFRSTVSRRRRPSSCTISPVCLPWNVATDGDSSLEQQGIIWKGWQNQHTVCWLSPCYSGVLLAPLCVQSIKGPSEMSGLKGGDAQFNQTFGCLCVQCHVPPSQRNCILRKTMGRNHPVWREINAHVDTFETCTEMHLVEIQQRTLLGALKREFLLNRKPYFCNHDPAFKKIHYFCVTLILQDRLVIKCHTYSMLHDIW